MGKNSKHILYHLFVVLASAGAALSLPFVVGVIANNIVAWWAFIENEKVFLVTIEIGTATGLILLFNAGRLVWEDRKKANMAKTAGLVRATPSQRLFSSVSTRTVKSMKQGQGSAREIMIIGSTGFHSIVQSEGDLHEALLQCREARLMLIDPREHGAIARAQSIPDPEITPEVIRDQILKSIAFIKKLRSLGKSVRLKLYPDMPLLKMAILGDFAYIRHYHTGLNVRLMPEFVFKNVPHHGGLYLPLYRYFQSRWQDPDIPEYDLDTDELLYHDRLGYEVLREPFRGIEAPLNEKDSDKGGSASRYVFR